ncbi:zinc-dependent peptidase [Rasiella sp. SM2506]|uniref:M90 family metallopeptidase n=1 Tax=Rasiella sp. SM2506 TaxID=3423914 RepID=UPI003D79E06F
MFSTLLFLTLVAFAVFAFTRTKKKKSPISQSHWHALLLKHVAFYSRLDTENQLLFRKRMQLFLDEVYVEGVKIKLDALDYVLVAASAVIPVFGFKDWHYNNLSGVLIYPDVFNEDLQFETVSKNRRILGMVGTGQFEGQMILSKTALRQGFSNKTDKHNTAIHEFVHLIDKTDGVTDGLPERLLQHSYTLPWLNLMHEEMEAIHKNKSDLRAYGGTNKQEFFAVASEYFFERPKLLKRKHPELYKMLEDCFQTKNYAK